MVSQRTSSQSSKPFLCSTPVPVEMGASTQTSSAAHRGHRWKPASEAGLRCAFFCALRQGVGCQCRAPRFTRAPPWASPKLEPYGTYSSGFSVPLNPDTTSRPANAARGRGLGIGGAFCGRCGATCALHGPRIPRVRGGLSRSQNWAPSFRAGPLLTGLVVDSPPALRVGSSRPQGRSRSAAAPMARSERPIGGPQVSQPFLDSGLRVSGWRRAEIEPQSWLYKPWSLGCFLGRRAEPRLWPPDAGLPVPGMQRLSWREARCVPRPASSATLSLSLSVLGFCFLPFTECRGLSGALEDSFLGLQSTFPF